jgi:tetratricopeptide (TPR) repeat protein
MSIADCYYQMDAMEQATNTYRRIVEDYPYDEESDQALLRLAHCEALAGRWDASGMVLGLLLEHSDRPESRHRALLLAAEILLQFGEYERAWDMLARADREFPNDTDISDLATRLARQKQDGKSLDDGAQDSRMLLEELRRNIRWGRGRRPRRARR